MQAAQQEAAKGVDREGALLHTRLRLLASHALVSPIPAPCAPPPPPNPFPAILLPPTNLSPVPPIPTVLLQNHLLMLITSPICLVTVTHLVSAALSIELL